jgi:hypothetical protein
MPQLLVVVLLIVFIPIALANIIRLAVTIFWLLAYAVFGVAYVGYRIVTAPFYAIFWLAYALYRLPGTLYRLPGAIRRYDYADPGGVVSVLMALGAILAVTLILTPFLPH